jgi:hypothetical protein
MAAASTVLLATSIAGAGGGLYGAIKSGNAAKDQAEFMYAQALQNTAYAEQQADDAYDRGNDIANRIASQGRQIVGAQRAGTAAQGIDISSGTAAELQAEAAKFSSEDAFRARVNAANEAFGYRTQAANNLSTARYGKQAAENIARDSLITGGLGAAQSLGNSYYMSKGGYRLPAAPAATVTPSPTTGET